MKIDIFDFLRAIPDIPNDKRGIKFKSKCPCGGEIISIRSKYNGHLHAHCTKCDCMLIE